MDNLTQITIQNCVKNFYTQAIRPSEELQMSIYSQQQPHIPGQEGLRVFSKYELRSISRMLIRLIRSNPRQQKEGTYDQQVASLPHSEVFWKGCLVSA